MSSFRQPDAATRDAQNHASNPAHSAWVSANAGSGKTHVLASRVVRLLLEGVPPPRILCLTFTKTAAAAMSARVFKWLADWAVADDAALKEMLKRTGVDHPVRPDLARRLFARAVETPGGLKIQTIHAFCERVLHLFPFEANVAADFRVVEELEQAELLAAARQAALHGLGAVDETRDDLALVAEGTWDGGFIELLDEAMRHRSRLAQGTATERRVRLQAALNLLPGETEATISHAILHEGMRKSEWTAIAERMTRGSTNDRKLGARLYLLAPLADALIIDDYLDLFRKSDGSWKDLPITAKLAGADPQLAEILSTEGSRLPALRDKLLATRIVARTAALERVCGAVIERYERGKNERALLDFDDLIARTDTLLTDAAISNWVLYKLDGGIDHILVDEAQDTSEPQWRILQALAREFTAGEGRSRAHRTFFAVGDEKQSIFSFQGAAPAMFDAMRREFQSKTVNARQNFAHVPLRLSFRSAPDVLEAVDHVFSDVERRRGLSSETAAPYHQPLKLALPGLVEIWPPIGATAEAPPGSWLLPLDRTGEHEPPARLAHKVATRIARLVEPDYRDAVEGETPGSLRSVRPGDIMVLVRRRDAFFEAVIRALKDKGVAVAGADRLDVVGHIAAMDCAAVARIALLPEDDLSLAVVLKSPFIGLDDEDLIALAPERTGTLFEALNGSSLPTHRAAAARIGLWRTRARTLRPFDFFSHLLGEDGGRRALLARLGPEANDALDEFLALALAQERTGPPSLNTFLSSLDALTLDVKRDLDATGDAVRVMTVHAAKGLEAKIVFLPDTCGVPTGNFDPKIYALDDRGTLAWSATKQQDPQPLLKAREDIRRRQEEEYRRLLYVAMTRAEERLYIAGYYGVRPPKPDCWHAMVSAALQPVGTVALDPLEEFGEILRFGRGQEMDRTGDGTVAPQPPASPAWLRTQAPAERGPEPPLRPSSALDRADKRNSSEGQAPTRARARGLAIHMLLRRLPSAPPSQRAALAETTLRTSWPDLVAEHAGLIREVLALIATPALADLFGPGSLGEVGVAATLSRDGAPPVRIAGQIDRLVETETEIIVADFKTGDLPSDGPPAAHLAQIALYAAALRQIQPDKPVRALLIYVAGPQIVAVDEATLRNAMACVCATVAWHRPPASLTLA